MRRLVVWGKSEFEDGIRNPCRLGFNLLDFEQVIQGSHMVNGARWPALLLFQGCGVSDLDWGFRLKRADLWSKRDDLRPLRTDFWPVKAALRPVRADLSQVSYQICEG